MNKESIRRLVESFISFVGDHNSGSSTLEDLERLSTLLHEILIQGRRIPNLAFDACVGNLEPALWPYEKRREICASRFPVLGFYNLPECITHQIDETNWLVGDAIDDLADIMGDLQEVRWYFEECYPSDVLWCFAFGYRSSWGYHAENLLWYLHALQRETK